MWKCILGGVYKSTGNYAFYWKMCSVLTSTSSIYTVGIFLCYCAIFSMLKKVSRTHAQAHTHIHFINAAVQYQASPKLGHKIQAYRSASVCVCLHKRTSEIIFNVSGVACMCVSVGPIGLCHPKFMVWAVAAAAAAAAKVAPARSAIQQCKQNDG